MLIVAQLELVAVESTVLCIENKSKSAILRLQNKCLVFFCLLCFRPRDFALRGDIVQSIEKICAHLGWTDDLLELQLEHELTLVQDPER